MQSVHLNIMLCESMVKLFDSHTHSEMPEEGIDTCYMLSNGVD